VSKFELTDEDREHLDGCRVVASISGGKDSAALSLWLTEQGIDHDRVFADTGWEHPATYEYLRGPLTDKIGPIVEVKSKVGGMPEWVRKKGMFPTRLRRYCTEELKLRPIRDHLTSLDVDPVNTVGIRAGESRARAQLPRWEEWLALDCDVWRPLIDWTEQDVIDTHHRHDLAPNPLYLRGTERVGCWPCIFSRKREIRLVADLTPERIDEVRQLEADVLQAATKRYAAKGETMESMGYHPPAFFHRQATAGNGGFVAIDDAVAWSRTAHGGRQLLMFDTEPAGCVRWGLCEAHHDDESS